MKTGGYQVLDLSGINFTRGVTQYVEGAYELIEGTRKVILVSGLEVNGVEYRDAFVDFNVENSMFIGSMYDLTIKVSTSGDGLDSITITNV